MSNAEETGNVCIMATADLFARISAQRKLLQRSPIEERAMISRCALRFNIGRSKQVDFNAEKIVLTDDDMTLLEKVVNDQFGLHFEGELRKLCRKVERPAPEEPVLPELSLEEAEEAISQPRQPEEKKKGFASRFKRLFGG